MLWKTSNGKELNPKDMSTSHIKNCIHMLKRKGKELENEFVDTMLYSNGSCKFNN